ncbi:MAG TPA: hypothetical protein VGL17_05695 [Gemmatimonadaceae bacterium]
MTLTDANGQLVEKLTVDGVATDSKGHVIARYDRDAETIIFASDAPGLGGTTLHTRDSISVRGPRVVDVKVGPLVKFRYRVTESNELRAVAIADDGAAPSVPGATESTVGHLEGYEASTAGAAWLGVMMCGATVIVPPRASLVLLDTKGHVVEQMAPDGAIQDHRGAVIGRYDAGNGIPGQGIVRNPSSDQVLDIRVVVRDPRDLAVWPAGLSFGYRIRIKDSNEVRIQRLERGSYPEINAVPGSVEEPLARLEGYVPSLDGAHRLGAMLSVLSSAEPHDPDARLPLERQPPPPPPLPASARRQ